MANDNVTFDFDFTPHKDYQPYSGDEILDPFPFDGFVAVQLANFRPYFSKESKHPMLKVGGVAQDEDAKGLRVLDDVMCGGKDRNGADMGRQFLDLLHSSGTTVEAIQQNAAKGQKADIMAICKNLENRIAYAEVGTELSAKDGKERTIVANWITKERYDQAKAVGAHRRPRRVATATAQAAQTLNLGGGAGVNGAAATGAAAASGASSMPML